MAFLDLYHKSLVEDATEAGLPDVGLVRVLLVWVIWLLTSRGECLVGPIGGDLDVESPGGCMTEKG